MTQTEVEIREVRESAKSEIVSQRLCGGGEWMGKMIRNRAQ